MSTLLVLVEDDDIMAVLHLGSNEDIRLCRQVSMLQFGERLQSSTSSTETATIAHSSSPETASVRATRLLYTMAST